MTSEQTAVLDVIRDNTARIFDLGCQIFDHPEIGRNEFFASKLLCDFLESEGFTVERGVGGLETAFRAVWEQGTGGPSIGMMMEYDALRLIDHACGHHLQGPVTIGAALALKAVCKAPFKLVLYGTPDEEGAGGKIDMVQNGCFRDVDAMFSCHTSQRTSASFSNKALAPQKITFHGTPAHASGSPWNGRSAMDAMLLMFHGLEIMREHVRDGSRIHYTISEGTGPSNVVHETAKCHVTLRSTDRLYLEDMQRRLEDVVKGACLMTGTSYEIDWRPVYWNYVPNRLLRNTVLDLAEELGAPQIKREASPGNGSSDIGNVSWVVPSVNLNFHYGSMGGHTAEHRDHGKTDEARDGMVSGSQIIALAALRCIEDAAFLAAVKAEYRQAMDDIAAANGR